MSMYVLVGMIASGKSTYAKTAATGGAIVVNDDSVVTAVHGGNPLLYRESLKPLYKSLQNHIVAMAVALGRDVVVDCGVNIRERSRRRWIGMAHSLDQPCMAVVFPRSSPEVHAKRRFSDDARGYSYNDWLAVAMSHERSYDMPRLDEGFARVIHVEE